MFIVAANSYDVLQVLSFKVELATLCLYRALISLQRLYEKVQCMLPALGATLTTAKEGCY